MAQSVIERVIRIESKLTRFVAEQQALNQRLDKMLNEWDDFKREWDEEGLQDADDTGLDLRAAEALPGSTTQRRSATG